MVMQFIRKFGLLALAVLVLGAAPASAQVIGGASKKISQDDQLNAVRALLLVPRGDYHFLSAYPIRLADGLGGTWAQTQGTEEDSASFAALAKQFCAGNTIDIDARDPLRLVFTRGAGTPRQLETFYNNVGGNAYVVRTDAAELAKVNGDDITTGKGEIGMARSGEDWNGSSIMFHPTPDVLIIEPNLAIPRTYIRCPK